MKASVLRYAAIGMASLSLAGVAAASTVTVGTTGPDSNQQVNLSNSQRLNLDNFNAAGVTNFNAQDAQSGDVSAAKNTSVSGGAGGSGIATNSNMNDTHVAVNNMGSGAMLAGMGNGAAPADTVSMNLTGPDSNNQVRINNSQQVNVTNDNIVNVENVNLQSAQSGDVSAFKNTTVGGLSSGGVANSNSNVTSINF